MNRFYCLLLFLGLLLLGGCRTTPSRNTNYTITINDSLFWKRTSIDSLVKIPSSTAQIIFVPTELQEGEERKEQQGQANVKIVRKDSLIYVTATCDSLEIRVQALNEELTKVSKQNEDLKEQVKAAPSKTKWFLIGLSIGTFIVSILSIIIIKKLN